MQTLLAWRRVCVWFGDNCMCQCRVALDGLRRHPGIKQIALSVSSLVGPQRLCHPWRKNHLHDSNVKECIPWIKYGRSCCQLPWEMCGFICLVAEAFIHWLYVESIQCCCWVLAVLVPMSLKGGGNNFNFQITEHPQLSQGNKVSLQPTVSSM